MDKKELDTAIEETVKKVMKEYESTKAKQENQRILYNTKMLMEGYKEMQYHIKNAVSEMEELDKKYGVLKTENAYLESMRRSKLCTALMISNIDRAMIALQKEMTETGQKHKYDAFKMHYIDGCTLEDIAERLNCGKNTPSRWIRELTRKMSIKLFGVNGVEKW